MSYNRYINNFPNESEFTKYIGGDLADVPNTALIDDTGEMKYTKSLGDYYLLSGTTNGTTDFMIGSLIDGDYSPDCINVHVVAKPDGNNEMYAKQEDVLKTPFNFSHGAGFSSTEGNKITSISKWKIDTSYVSNMDSMFYNCSSLTSLDLSNFDTSRVTSIASFFSGCSSLTSLDLSSLNTSNVTQMVYLFDRCSSLNTIDLSGFDISKITSMSGFFNGCSSLTSLDLSSLNTSNVTEMSYVFGDCSSLTSLDLRNFDTSNVTTMYMLFSGCRSLTSVDLSSFNTSNVTDMRYVFSNCSSLTSLDLRNFDTTSVTQMYGMFRACSNLNKLYLSNNFFNSTTVTEYDFSGLTAWTDAESLAKFVEAITVHDGTGKTVKLSIETQNALTDNQKSQIQSKHWTISN